MKKLFLSIAIILLWSVLVWCNKTSQDPVIEKLDPDTVLSWWIDDQDSEDQVDDEDDAIKIDDENGWDTEAEADGTLFGDKFQKRPNAVNSDWSDTQEPTLDPDLDNDSRDVGNIIEEVEENAWSNEPIDIQDFEDDDVDEILGVLEELLGLE
mgnify:CR=1 FL=1